MSPSFLGGTCVLSTARQNLPPRLLTAKLPASETERIREQERQREMEERDREVGEVNENRRGAAAAAAANVGICCKLHILTQIGARVCLC